MRCCGCAVGGGCEGCVLLWGGVELVVVGWGVNEGSCHGTMWGRCWFLMEISSNGNVEGEFVRVCEKAMGVSWVF